MTDPGARPGTKHSYAGIGSRRAPQDVLELMSQIASRLATAGWVLRTGLASGSDQAFYRAAVDRGPLELYLPWRGFQANALLPGTGQFVLPEPSEAALELAARFHPAWGRLSEPARRLHARNCHQILGCALDSPVAFVVCWTPDASLDGRGRRVGGTGQALRIAHSHGIAVFNLARSEHRQRLQQYGTGADALR